MTTFHRPAGVQTDPVVAMQALTLRGSAVRAELTEAVTAAGLSWSTSEVTELAVTLEDPGFTVWRRAQFEVGATLVYTHPDGGAPIPLRISAIDLAGGSSGIGAITVKARSDGAWQLKRRKGPLVMPNTSPSGFVTAEAGACGLRAVCQPTATRTQIARDVPDAGAETSTAQGSTAPSSWTTIQRLASEVGFVSFEFGGVMYFAQPTWLLARAASRLRVLFGVDVPPAWAGPAEAFAAQTCPGISLSVDSTVPVEVRGVEVPRSRFPQARPGGVLELAMTAPFNGSYLISSVSMPLLGVEAMNVDASTPRNPDPQPPDTGATTPEAPTAPAGSRSALEFVAAALQSGGGGGPDAAELIRWALARVGVPFPDSAAAQITACDPRPVNEALSIRGALLFRADGIDVSLGNRRTLRDVNGGVVWLSGGIVPGLRYP